MYGLTGWSRDKHQHPSDRHHALLDRLAQNLEDMARALRPFIQEENAVVRERPPTPPLPSGLYLLPGGASTVSRAGTLTDSCELSWFPVSHAATALLPCQPLTIHRWYYGRPR